MPYLNAMPASDMREEVQSKQTDQTARAGSTHNIMYTVQSPDMMKGVGGRRGEKRGERERGESWSDTDSAAWQAVPGCFRSQLTVFHPGPRDFHFSHIYFLLQILLVSSVFSY